MTLSVVAAARDAGSRVALCVGARDVTYAELAALAGRRMAWLAERGVPRGAARPVALVGRSDLSSLALLHALVEQGTPAALVHPRFTERERARVVALLDSALVVAESPTDADTPDAPPPALGLAVDPERALAILFTSGTTGEPKGVVLSRRAFVASAAASHENLPLGPGDRWLLGLPIAHVGGLSVLTRSLVARSTVVVPAEVAAGERLRPEALRECLEREGVTLASLVPTQLEWLLDAGFSPPPSLRVVLLGGAAARPALLARAAERGVPVLTTYGLTEACSQVTTERFGAPRRADGAVGWPLRGTEVRITEGAIEVRGPTLLTGYLTSAGLVSPLGPDGFFRTDDLGRLDAEGRLHVLGRRSDLLVTGGENVYPAEVEAVLERAAGVRSACIFGVPDELFGDRVVAALVVGDPAGFDLGAFARFVVTELAPHRRPRAVALVASLAVTGAGKLDRKATAALAAPLLVPLGST
ncbi:MAG TPA: AMP-binding protein [Polyangiaceae bacterium]|nr:AMP-binding protein [Polyangiaceae bacterium]